MSQNNTFVMFGLRFHSLKKDSALDIIENYINFPQKPRMIFTPTAELIVRANEKEMLREVYNSCDILTIDSFVVYYFAKLLRKPAPEPVNAARLMLSFLPVAHKRGYKIYLLGAREDVLRRVVDNLRKQYPGINIVGWHNGYFDFDNDYEIVKDIREKKPDILFVAMSSPLKEKFVSKNLNQMNVPVSIGVGGTFDIIAGKCKLAPKWISRLGLEWFYRLIQEPKRLWRRYLVTNMKFLFLFLKEFIKPKGGFDGGVQKLL